MINNNWFRQGVVLLLAYLFYLLSWNTAFGFESTPTMIELKGYLSKEDLNTAAQKITQAPDSQSVVLILNSTSGDLPQALELAKQLYERKLEQHLHLIVYIEDNAVGPAALFPLLADELYISLFVSWGDITAGNEKLYSNNILRNRVISLITPDQPHSDLLRLLAAAMSDPSIHIVDDHGWRLATSRDEGTLATISPIGETLVVNHNQLRALDLVKGVLSPEKFRAAFHFPAEKPSQPALSTLEGQPIAPKMLQEELQKHIIFTPQGPNIVGHILIDDRTSGINQSTWLYVKSALDYYKKVKPIFVILELNTPGGEVFAAQQISDALKELDTQYNIPVVAWVNNWAISAGAMLAYSSRFIVTAKDGSMGAAEPVLADASGKMEAASEKVNSAMRADFANRARFFNRDPLIAEKMVDKDILLVMRHGKMMKLDNESQIRSTGTDPDLIISPKGKLLTLDASQMLDLGVADMIVPPTKTEAIASEEMDSGKWPAKTMALFHQPFFNNIPNAMVDSYRMDWKTRFFTLLASPMVASLLFLGMVVGFYMEFSGGGFGLAGTVAVTCLFLIILSSFALEIANWLELILLLVGLGVILVELFVLPTFGLLGFIGIIFFLMGLFGMMLPGANAISFEFDTHTFNAAGQAFFERLAWLAGTLVVASLIIAFLARFLTPKLAGFSRFVLHGNEQEGYIAVDNPADLPPVGSVGEAATTLRPAGKVIIQDRIYDAISGGSFIDKGTAIQVARLDGSTIVVETKNALDRQESR